MTAPNTYLLVAALVLGLIVTALILGPLHDAINKARSKSDWRYYHLIRVFIALLGYGFAVYLALQSINAIGH